MKAYAAASAGFCIVGIGVALLLHDKPVLFGVSAAALGALCAMSALAASSGKTLNGVLAAFVAGFLCRGLLVAVGLIASGARGGDALRYAFAFFLLYAATQVVEVLFVRAQAQGATP